MIYPRLHVCSMNNLQKDKEIIAFSSCEETLTVIENIAWTQKTKTKLAHPSGRIPSRSNAVGWQPWHIPGQSKKLPVYSESLNGLIRRVRTQRGEA